MWEIAPRMSTYSKARAKVKKLICEVQFPGNWFEFDIIEDDFEALQSELFRLNSQDTEIFLFSYFALLFQNAIFARRELSLIRWIQSPKIPGIQSSYVT